MDELVEFLRARLDEDEQIAGVAAGLQADPENGWGVSGHAITPHIGVVHEDEARMHIARHDPARVLREADAKRQVIREWEDARATAEADQGDVSARVALLAFTITLSALASVYADHPDYREEWRP
ncbi:DUF6221 family protein [Streptomyces sp. NPDC038707]|uniref:DUF6221 family protein n=1 Tax=Streptomyces sp. NPDC038707 TaxID=3154329 RepID=UPI0033DA01A9